MSGQSCGISFWCQYPEYPAQIVCELDRYHDGPHIGQGFAFGPVDQSCDVYVQAMRKAEHKRRDKVRGWHRLVKGKS